MIIGKVAFGKYTPGGFIEIRKEGRNIDGIGPNIPLMFPLSDDFNFIPTMHGIVIQTIIPNTMRLVTALKLFSVFNSIVHLI